MSGPEDAGSPAAFGAAYWQDRYRSAVGARPHGPTPALVEAAADLPPGRALDAGCGVGGDALWLASRGWQVTAVDVSEEALAQARRWAGADGEGVAWVCADLTDWRPGDGGYDLVTSAFVHAPGPAEALYARLASWVAPGGTLLVVGHDGAPAGHGSAHPPGAHLTSAQVTGGLPADEWEVLPAGPTSAGAADGAAPRADTVVRARRTAPARP